jgi:hypothetical protein
MIKAKEFREFERTLLKKEKIDIKRNIKILEALYEEAVALGVIPFRDPLDGLDVDLRIAKVVNSVSKAS